MAHWFFALKFAVDFPVYVKFCVRVIT